MTEFVASDSSCYQSPSETILQNRRAFYLSQKQSAEPITQWFYRIRDAIQNCNFGTLTDFLIIDKFLCELDSDELQWMLKTDTWSLDQLCQAVVNQKSFIIKNQHFDDDTEQSTVIDDFLKVELDDIGNDEIFFDTNAASDDSDDDQQLSEVKRQIEVDKNAKEVPVKCLKDTSNGHRKKQTKTSKTIRTEKEIKGFTIDAENRYHCLDCGKIFKHKSTYTQHQRLHTGRNLFYCTVCSKVFLKPSKLKKHFQKHEREQDVAGKTFECHLCKFQFIRLQGLRAHVNVKHVSSIKNDFQCTHCSDVFLKQTQLDDHLRSEHHLNIAFKCPHCDKAFEHDRPSDLKEHLLTHSEVKPFMCEVCGNVFKTRRQLQLHMARHTDERRFKCNECGRMLKSRSNYKNHIRQHTGERPFRCDHNDCGKTFVQRANYIKHLRWHSGIKPHGCTFPSCDKRFPTAYDLKLHVNSVHTGAKPFACLLCDSKFSQPSTLRVHRMRVHRSES